MKFLKKFLDTFLALLPILVIVLFVHIFFYRFETKTLINFVLAVVLVSVGETFFLTGVDSTIMPMGELMVNSVNKASKFFVFVMFAILFGMCATIAEPDVTIFSNQVITAGGVSVAKNILVFSIGAGVGILIALAILRIIKNINVKYIYLILFAIIFLLCTQVKSEYIAIAFDAGGATTGIITAPFLFAISSGITTRFTDNKDNNEVFGMVGLASLGPIIAVLIVFALAGENVPAIAQNASSMNIFLSVLKNSYLAVIPLAAVFFVYDLLFIKLPLRKKTDFIVGLLITFVGLYMFLFGIDFGITNMGTAFGDFIESLSTPLIVVLCVVLGFVITFCEPSVLVLAKQVKTATKGNIPSGLVLISIAIAMSFAILISALKILYNINFFYIVMVGYLIALILMFVVPSIFTSMAFDSGGVASGPMTSAFLIPIMLQLASNTSSNALSGFGLIGIVSMSPIVVLQILGLVYRIEIGYKVRKEQRQALAYSYSAEMYSNIKDLEDEHKMILKEKEREK